MKMRRNLTFLLMACVLYSPASVAGQDSRNNPIQTNLTAQNEYERKALRLVALIQAGDTEGATAYDAACAFALAGKKEEAFRYLELAIARGYANPEHMKRDSDLEPLRADPRWQPLITKAEAKRTEQQSLFQNKKEFWDNPALEIPYKENLSEDEKIAGLSKFWSEAKFNFANFDLVPELNWDHAFLEFLPRVRQTKTTLEYYRVLQELTAKLKDGHTNVAIPSALNDEVYAIPLISTRRIEDKVLINNVYDNELLQNGIARGQEIVEIDGIPVEQYAEQRVKP